jgi:hypothetical protein
MLLTARPINGRPHGRALVAFLLALFAFAATAAGVCAGRAIEDVSLTLREDGFHPPEVTVTAGRFLLSLDNRSGVEVVTLRLAVESGEVLRDIPVPKDAADWAEQVDLAAGSYLLTEINHPGWACRLVAQ